MSDINFTFDNVRQYKAKIKTTYLKKSLLNEGTMAIFDKNFDKKISKAELDAVSKEQYQQCIDVLKNTNEGKDVDFHEYENLVEFADDGFISIAELDNLVENYNLKEKELEEKRDLKDIAQMSKDEILSELKEYGIEKDTNLEELKQILSHAREERSNYDQNSKEVDGHIGTFVQPEINSHCTLLSVIDTLSDEQVKDICKKKTDENGEVYYEVTFPQDKGSDKAIKVTQKELDAMSITVNENGKDREVLGFSTGDLDVALLEMAFVKRFGTDTFDNGGQIDISRNVFVSPEESLVKPNINLEEIEDFSSLPPNTTISMLYAEDFIKKGITQLPYELSDGRMAFISLSGIKLSDGVNIPANHAMSIRGYDETTNELIVSGNNFNSSSELRLPKEILKYFKMALPENVS